MQGQYNLVLLLPVIVVHDLGVDFSNLLSMCATTCSVVSGLCGLLSRFFFLCVLFHGFPLPRSRTPISRYWYLCLMVQVSAFRCQWFLGLVICGFHVLLSVGSTFRCLFSHGVSLKEWLERIEGWSSGGASNSDIWNGTRQCRRRKPSIHKMVLLRVPIT